MPEDQPTILPKPWERITQELEARGDTELRPELEEHFADPVVQERQRQVEEIRKDRNQFPPR